MPGKFDAEFMKKHHFWLLLIPATLFAFLACIFVFADVAAETSSIDEKNQAEMKKLDQAKKAPKATIGELDKQNAKLEIQQNKMWQQAWNEQKTLFVWPSGYSESKEYEDAKKMPFGSTDLDDRRFATFRREFGQQSIYQAEYNNLAETLAPMQFAGGIDSVLRIQKWSNLIPNSEDMWLALEDLWVQREMLTMVNQVNLNAAKFEPVKNQPGLYRSSIWELRLKWERKEGGDAPNGPGNYLLGQIRNVSPRLQVFGLNNLLKINVWFNDEKREPFVFKIEGTSLPGDPKPEEDRPEKWMKIKTIKPHLLPVDTKPESIVKVEQLFDTRTVPVKQIERFSLGKLSDRISNQPLIMSRFSAKKAETAAPPPTESTGKDKMPGGNMTGGPPRPAGFNGGDDGKKTETSTSQYGLPRQRYVAVTEQVRRMPLALTVVTDQTYMDEILKSTANTKMRFQMMQSHWNRFHGTLNYGNAPATGADMNRPGQTAAPTSNREDQFSANLLEVSIYGIISLYERYPEPTKTPAPKKK